VQIHFTPDSNVRTAPPGPGRDPRRRRACGVARSLLSLRLVYVALLGCASSMSACIIPVAPNFQDPPSTPDSPPYLSNFQPSDNAIVTVPVPDGLVFSANVTDPDLGDTLQVRWAVDYPPYAIGNTVDDQTPISPSANGQPINAPVTEKVNCVFVNSSTPSTEGTHRLELIVADRTFSDPSTQRPDQALESIDDKTGFVVRASWTFVISCPALMASTSSVSGSP
jgi:hypothetical protein